MQLSPSRAGSPFIQYADRDSWAFAGDSIMVGNTSTARGGCRAQLLESLGAYYGTQLKAYGDVYPNVVGDNYAGSYSYPIMGAAGMTSAQIHATYTSVQAPIYAPDYWVAGAGSNDAATGVATETYVANMMLILDDFRTANPTSHGIILNCPDRVGFTATIVAYNAALLIAVQARADYIAGLLKHADFFTAEGDASGANFGDGIHPNQTLGYPIMADLIYNTFLTF